MDPETSSGWRGRMTGEGGKKKSDLGVRAASAVVMVAVAGTALWLGGWFWVGFVCILAVGVFWEWQRLVNSIANSLTGKLVWLCSGVVYVGLAALVLCQIRIADPWGSWWPFERALAFVGLVIAVDVGAYFAGRAIGGPKIAAKISPSKTWAGLFGGILAASIFFFCFEIWALGQHAEASHHECMYQQCLPSGIERWWHAVNLPMTLTEAVIFGTSGAIVAQAGDFFESWMKRRAGVKDSSNLIPGHGGLFDRVDGLLAVSACTGLFAIWIGV